MQNESERSTKFGMSKLGCIKQNCDMAYNRLDMFEFRPGFLY